MTFEMDLTLILCWDGIKSSVRCTYRLFFFALSTLLNTLLEIDLKQPNVQIFT